MQENGLWNMYLDAFSTKLSISQNFIRHQLFVEGKRIQRLNASTQDVQHNAKGGLLRICASNRYFRQYLRS